MTDPSPDPILAYLREHAARYGVADLREQLLWSGYDPAAVDRTIQAFRAENPPGLWELVWKKALRVLGVNACLVGAGTALAFAPGTSDDVKLGIALTLLAVLFGELLGGLAIFFFWRKKRPLALALLAGFFSSIALGALLLGSLIYSDR
jgi:hypothetical protein